jgi:UDP-GlcNAc:undecaprenyl-phosphate/decaprenyl-phosphate GlcNAc-1-phosphate transferase
MLPLLIIPVASCGCCLVLTPLVRGFALKWGLVDCPDGRRKLHGGPIPLAGGLAILLSMLATLALLVLTPNPLRTHFLGQAPSLLGLLAAALLICALGVTDDLGRLRGRHKLLGQILAAGVLVSFGVQVRAVAFFGWEVQLGLLSVPFTLFLLVGAMNSLNLLDGMDGLLGSIGLVISLTTAAMAMLSNQGMAACVALALAGALLGFLRHNLPPASIFLGDSGSMLIGLVVGVLAIQASLKAPATVILAAPTALLAIPIFDTTAAIVRRKLTGRSIYMTDRGHLHHCLLRRGFSRGRVLLLLACCCLVTGSGALASLAFHNELFALLSALAVVSMLVVTGLFGRAELSLLGQWLQSTGGSFLRGPADPRGRETEVRLQGCLDWNELWRGVSSGGRRLNLKAICLDVNAPALFEGYHARWDRPDPSGPEEAPVWRAEIPLVIPSGAIGRLEVVGYQDEEPVWEKIAILAELAHRFETRAALLAPVLGDRISGGGPAASLSGAADGNGRDRVPTGNGPAPRRSIR